MGSVLRFGFVWLMVGFATGTLTLLGPVRWLTTAVRQSGRTQVTENTTVIGVILVWLVLSALLSRWIAQRWRRAEQPVGRYGVPVGLAAVAVVVLAFWLNPRYVAGYGAVREAAGERFVFGPYPTARHLVQLKRQGYVGVITLLHPAVVPFEPKLLSDERAAAQRVGIPLIELPMLPWISDNGAALDSIRALVRAGGGPYYVHCYLGRDRVNVVRRVLEQAGGSTRGTGEGARKLDDVRTLERGAVVRLDSGVYLTPYPTDEEYLAYLIAGGVRTVVSLLDPQSAEDRPWIEKESAAAAGYGLELVSVPVRAEPFDPQAALEAARRLRAAPRPAVAHGFLTASVASEAVMLAYRADLPPLPPTLFREPLAGGAAEVVRTNVAVGPAPAPHEYATLRSRGVAGVVFLEQSPGAGEPGRAAATGAGLTWERAAPSPALLARLARGGTWYLFGPGLPALRQQLGSGAPTP